MSTDGGYGDYYREETATYASGVAGPLAAQGGGQICRPFVLGFWNWRACLMHKSKFEPDAANDPT